MKTIESGLQDLFRYAYATNCHLDNYAVTSNELTSIKTFSPLELLENFKDLLLNLLTFKKNNLEQQTKESRVLSLSTQHQLEVQYHIKLQSELKHLLSTSISREEHLLIAHEKALRRIKDLETHQANSEKYRDWEEIKDDLTQKIQNLNEKIDEKETYMNKLENENLRLREMLEEKFIEIEILKKNMKRRLIKGKESRSLLNIEVSKKNLETKALELIKNQQRIKENNVAPYNLKDRNRENRKSYNSQDFSELIIRASSKAHRRSSSDYKK